MKKITYIACLFFIVFPSIINAQIPFLERKLKKANNELVKEVRKGVREEMKEEGKREGKEALDKITYENDTRYAVPDNPVQATIAIRIKSYKRNGKLDNTSTMKLVFGPTGEIMIMNEGGKQESRMLFDYEGAAMYMLNVKEKIATKMPMINFQKMASKIGEMSNDPEKSEGQWKKTTEHKTINGYPCRKYTFIDEDKNKMVMWFTQAIEIDLSDNHLFGGKIKDFSTKGEQSKNLNAPQGLMVRSLFYNEGADTPSSQMDIVTFDKTYDPAYFNMKDYKINDVMNQL